MNMSKSRDIQAKMPSPKVILSFKCILARNCEGTEQLHKILYISVNSADFYCYFFNSKTHKKILWL